MQFCRKYTPLCVRIFYENNSEIPFRINNKQLLYSLDQNHSTFYLTCTLVQTFSNVSSSFIFVYSGNYLSIFVVTTVDTLPDKLIHKFFTKRSRISDLFGGIRARAYFKRLSSKRRPKCRDFFEISVPREIKSSSVAWRTMEYKKIVRNRKKCERYFSLISFPFFSFSYRFRSLYTWLAFGIFWSHKQFDVFSHPFFPSFSSLERSITV